MISQDTLDIVDTIFKLREEKCRGCDFLCKRFQVMSEKERPYCIRRALHLDSVYQIIGFDECPSFTN